MLSVKVRITGDKELIAKLRKLGPSFTDFRTSMNSIGRDVSAYYSNVVFASQGGVLGHKWQAVNPKYAVWKSKHYLGNRGTLIATGAMQGSFTHEATNNSVVISNSVSYFKYHQSSAPRTKMPYRPMMGINTAVRGIIQDTINTDVTNKIKRAGL